MRRTTRRRVELIELRLRNEHSRLDIAWREGVIGGPRREPVASGGIKSSHPRFTERKARARNGWICIHNQYTTLARYLLKTASPLLLHQPSTAMPSYHVHAPFLMQTISLHAALLIQSDLMHPSITPSCNPPSNFLHPNLLLINQLLKPLTSLRHHTS
jgi:hypothetical protein